MERTSLPAAADVADFERVRRDEAALGPGVAAICARHGAAPGSAERFADGSLPVYAIGATRVLKLYPPCFASSADAEAAALERIAGRLPVPTPCVLATGELDGWRYVVMERLHGEKLSTAWPGVPRRERARLVEAVGQALAALHALDVGDADARLPRPNWRAFLARQRAGCVARQAARGLGTPWLAQVEAFLDATKLDGGGRPARVALLHTEVMREHLLVERRPGGFVLSGLFDLEPAMIGAPEYELASVGLFVTCGDATLLRRALWAYGYAQDELGPALSRRLLAYACLHVYSNLRWYLERVPPPAGATTLDALAQAWFGT